MVRNEIEQVVNQLVSAPKFLYGTANELNKLADSQDWTTGIVMLYTLKTVQLDYTLSNTIDSKYSLYLEFLYLTPYDQYTSQNEQIITQAYWLMKEFLVKLSYFRFQPNDARYFKIHNEDKAQSLPVYNKLDVNSTGVNLTLTLSKMTPHSFDPASRPPGYVSP